MPIWLNISVISWAPFPFIRFFVAYALGIITYIFLKPPTDFLMYLIPALVIIYFAFKLLVKDSFFYKISTLLGLIGLFILYLTGIFVSNFKHEILKENHFSKYKAEAFLGNINSTIHTKNGELQTEIVIKSVLKDSEWIKTKGKCLVKFKTLERNNLKYGSDIIFTKKPSLVENAGNPYEFDYKAYLSYNNIYHRINLTDNDYEITVNKPSNFIIDYSLKSAGYLDSILQTHIHSKQEQGIARALFLGIKDGLDNEIRQAYSSAGAMHVLAVSGMHVAILFQLLSMFLQRLSFFKKNNLYSGITLLVFVWFYAFITGGSASVLRAVVMFSFTIAAKIFDKRTNIYNTLAMSAFALTLYDPYLIMSVGFQLSYLAVIGIVYIYPKINLLLEFTHFIKKWIWDIVCISVAAQIATFPISVLYFHQFPSYFIFSNLFVIPVAMLVMYSGIAMFFTSFIPVIGIVLGYFTEKVIWLMNYGILNTEKIPGSLIEGLYISVIECIAIYGFIWLAIALFQNKNYKLIYLASIMVLFFTLSISYRMFNNSKKEKLYVYNHYSGFFAQYIAGKNSVILANEHLAQNQNTIDYISKPINLRFGTNKPSIKEINTEENQELTIQNKSVLIVNESISDFAFNNHYHLVFWNNKRLKDFEKFVKEKQPKLLMISPRIPVKYYDKMTEIAIKNNVVIHFVKESAFEIDLKS
jgi:competence protein ComEC